MREKAKNRQPHTIEHKQSISDGLQEFYRNNNVRVGSNSGINNPMYGRNHTNNTKKLISSSNKGKRRSLETRENMSMNRTGQNNNMYMGLIQQIDPVTMFVIKEANSWEFVAVGFNKSCICACINHINIIKGLFGKEMVLYKYNIYN
jgi:hypothetical protein